MPLMATKVHRFTSRYLGSLVVVRTRDPCGVCGALTRATAAEEGAGANRGARSS